MAEPLLSVHDLAVRFDTPHGSVRAVDGVSFDLEQGECLGLVGESGSGKSVTNLALLGLVPMPPGVIESGSVHFGGRDLLALSPEELRRIRGNRIAMIFQDPMTSLNPLLTVGRQLTEVLEQHRGLSHREARDLCARGLGDVGIPDPEARLDSWPHELSGGMRQRVMIAMALLCQPQVLIADEPTTALDVTIQAQILELLADLQERHGTAIVLITHDLGVVAGMADRVHVMYAGRLVESADTSSLFARPLHPYTEGLLASIPSFEDDSSEPLASIPGQPPDLVELPPGCAFEPRCPLSGEVCGTATPPLEGIADPRAAGPRHSACLESAVLLGRHATPEGTP
ncbi:MAG: ABC transporter ATP-binding protein [Planctomycetota bacterium]|nr:ABC transporter ATP-binding protein [Planctomycetota bacterium]